MDDAFLTRRSLLGLALAVPALAFLSACGGGEDDDEGDDDGGGGFNNGDDDGDDGED